MSEIKVSVVVPCYNAEKLLKKCIDSILNQTLRETELICVDDGSTDSTLSILREYEKVDNRVTVLAQQNQYAGVARNNGMAIAKGKYIMFLDSDDFFDLKMLEQMYLKCEEDGADICLTAQYAELDLRTNKVTRFVTSPIGNIVSLPFSPQEYADNIFQIAKPIPWNKMFNLSFLKHEGILFQEIQRSNDVFASGAAIAVAEKITLINESFVTRTAFSTTSLTETMDSNSLLFYESSKALKTFLVERGLLEVYLRSFLEGRVLSAIHALHRCKTKKSWFEVAKFLKTTFIPEFEIYTHLNRIKLNSYQKNLILFIHRESLLSMRFHKPSLRTDIGGHSPEPKENIVSIAPNDTINVCFLTDDGFAMPTMVAIASLLEHRDTRLAYNIHVISNNLTTKHQSLFQQSVQSADGVDLRIVIADQSLDTLKQLHNSNRKQYKLTALLKFYLPELLPEVDKVLFLDGDILIQTTLHELYTTELGDNLVAAVRDLPQIFEVKTYVDKNIAGRDYFNSGVMLLNLSQMRIENTSKSLIKAKQSLSKQQFLDQDAFNLVFKNRTSQLPICYNFSINREAQRYNAVLPKINKAYNTSYNNYEDLLDAAQIIHYSSPIKPWVSYGIRGSDLWNYYYNKSVFGSVVLQKTNENKINSLALDVNLARVTEKAKLLNIGEKGIPVVFFAKNKTEILACQITIQSILANSKNVFTFYIMHRNLNLVIGNATMLDISGLFNTNKKIFNSGNEWLLLAEVIGQKKLVYLQPGAIVENDLGALFDLSCKPFQLLEKERFNSSYQHSYIVMDTRFFIEQRIKKTIIQILSNSQNAQPMDILYALYASEVVKLENSNVFVHKESPWDSLGSDNYERFWKAARNSVYYEMFFRNMSSSKDTSPKDVDLKKLRFSRLIQCYKDHGFFYTIHLGVSKIRG